MKSLNHLLHGFAPPLTQDIEVLGLSLDSRTIKPNEVFVALKGWQNHGLQFVQTACQKNASAIIYQRDEKYKVSQKDFVIPVIEVADLEQHLSEIAARFFDNPCENLEITAITGTNGKSSVAYGLNQILIQNAQKSAVIGTLGFGTTTISQKKTLTTPDSITTQKIIAELKKSSLDYLVLEASSHGLIQGRINSVPVKTAIYTNISHDHLDYHKNMAEYKKAKQLLFEKTSVKTAIININDEFGKTLARKFASKLRVINYGINIPKQGEFLSAENIEIMPRSIKFNLVSSWGNKQININLLGRFNVENLLAMLAGYLSANGDFAKVKIIAQNIKPLNGRMECFGSNNQPLVVVDFAHTPDALNKSLLALREHMQATAKLFCVFGCGGDRDKQKRPLMAKIAEEHADFIIITDDNPRTEPSEQIIGEIIGGFTEKSQITIIKERDQAIFSAVNSATKDDVVLIAGKGHEQEQIIADQRLHFSDREQVEKILC